MFRIGGRYAAAKRMEGMEVAYKVVSGMDFGIQ